MKALASILCVGILAVVLIGCGSGDENSALDTAAPPPGPNANLHPPTKGKGIQPPAPPSASGGGPGTAGPAPK